MKDTKGNKITEEEFTKDIGHRTEQPSEMKELIRQELQKAHWYKTADISSKNDMEFFYNAELQQFIQEQIERLEGEKVEKEGIIRVNGVPITNREHIYNQAIEDQITYYKELLDNL